MRVSKTVNGTTTTHILDGANVVADIKDGANWYAYCGNNPVMFVDPWGLKGMLSGDSQYWEVTFLEMQELTDDKLDYNRDTGEIFILEEQLGDKTTGTELLRDILKDEDYTVYIQRNGLDNNGQSYSTEVVRARPKFAEINIREAEVNDENSYLLLKDENGKSYLQSYAETPSFLFLGHELIHVQHEKNGTFNSIRNGVHYFMYNNKLRHEQLNNHVNDEYETVGIMYFTLSNNPNSKSINPKCQISTYQPITENTLRQEHGLDKRAAYSTFDVNGNFR